MTHVQKLRRSGLSGSCTMTDPHGPGRNSTVQPYHTWNMNRCNYPMFANHDSSSQRMTDLWWIISMNQEACQSLDQRWEIRFFKDFLANLNRSPHVA